jgi:D-serine deaminase-like pyridoxal phosphate-dependent protein
MEISQIKTPGLLLDVDRVKTNAARMSDIAERNGVRLRPHIKTHKCIEVARIQTAGHGNGVTVSTLKEARAFAENGFDDITYAVPIEPGKFDEAISLRRGGVKLNLLTDDAATVGLLDDAAGKAGIVFDVFLKVDVGTHRVGVEPTSAEAIAIPRQITNSKHLGFAGILTHAGHSYDVNTQEEVLDIARYERDAMVELASRLRNDGIVVPCVSVGSTPTMTHVDHLNGIDEIRPGNYIFFDNFQATLGSCSFADTALTVIAAVIHHSRNKLVIDAGAVALSKDRGPTHLDPACGYGRVLDIDGNETGLRVTGMSQEHGQIASNDAAAIGRFKVGDRVRILANHSCLTAAQHTHYNVLEKGKIVYQWPIHQGW